MGTCKCQTSIKNYNCFIYNKIYIYLHYKQSNELFYGTKSRESTLMTPLPKNDPHTIPSPPTKYDFGLLFERWFIK